MIAEIISQVGILIFGVLAAWITQQRNESLKKYACVLGLISQPFWLYASWQSGQWGVFAVSVIYVYIWGLGINNFWIRPVNSQANLAADADSLQGETKQ